MNQATLNTVTAAALAKVAGNARWTRAIEKAAALASDELCVTLLSGYALVTSPRGSYHVNGCCECEAARRGHAECYHRAAVRLVEMLEAAPAVESDKSDRPAATGATSARRPTITRSIERNYNGAPSAPFVAVRCNNWLV